MGYEKGFCLVFYRLGPVISKLYLPVPELQLTKMRTILCRIACKLKARYTPTYSHPKTLNPISPKPCGEGPNT